MKRLAALLIAAPSVALAHPGAHSALDLFHLLTQPDHLALGAVALVVVAVVIYQLRSRP